MTLGVASRLLSDPAIPLIGTRKRTHGTRPSFPPAPPEALP